MRKYVLGIILALLLGFFGIFNADTMALDSDYKNNLLKVDLIKAGDDNYKLELFTQKPYSEPVKVIQKSETSYYVLLPETYHSITSVPVSGDITKVDVKLYPYAGQDLNNGYTKINISTAKPLTFSTNVKTSGGSKPQIDSRKLAQLDKAFDNKNVKTNVPVKVDTTKNMPVQTAKTQTPKVAEPVKVAAAPSTQTAKEVKKVDTNTASEPVKVASAPKNVQVAAQGQSKPSGGTEIEIVTKPKVQEPIKQQEIAPSGDTNPVSLEEVLETEATGDDELAMEQDAIEQGLTEIATGEDEPIPVLTKKQRVKQAVKALIITLTENFLLVIAIILLIIALVLLSKGKQAEVAEKSYGYTAKDGEIGGDGAFGTVQPVEPAAGEYPVYEPGLEPAGAAVNANEGYEPQMAPVYEEANVATAEEETSDEADVLATESFGENRGLCLVNYDGSIALIGYIEEEIFVIQNFGKITLLNPSIQIRVAEQNDNDTIYIVKTANSKLMVRETKELIGLEMVM